MGFRPRYPGWFYAVLILCPAGGAAMAHSCGVETRSQAADTREPIEGLHENLPLAVLLCGSAGMDAGALGLGSGSSCAVAVSAPTNEGFGMPFWDDNGVGEPFIGVDLELDESLLHVGAPLRAGERAGEGEPGAARPARTLVWRRRSARRPPRADVDSSTPPLVGGTKWAVWGGLLPASVSHDEALDRASRDEVLDGTSDVPEVDGKPRVGAPRGAGHADRRRAMERISGLPPSVVDAVASGGVPIYRPIGSPEGVGIVLKPGWRGVTLNAVFELPWNERRASPAQGIGSEPAARPGSGPRARSDHYDPR
jgi:hypothetical protein